MYPWLVSFVSINAVAVTLHYTKRHLPYVLVSCVISIVGLAMIVAAPSGRYGGFFLSVLGLYSAMSLVVCCNALNMGSHLRKSVATACQIGFGDIGGLVATFIFLNSDAPQ